MEQLSDGQDYTAYELPAERADDPDVVLMSTGKPVLKKDMDAYKESFVDATRDEENKRSFDMAIAIGAAGAMAFAIFAAVRNRKSGQQE